MKQANRHLTGEGEMDYDYINDILFFKVKNREYDRSLEFENLVIDIDSENFIIGIQIFDASKFLRIHCLLGAITEKGVSGLSFIFLTSSTQSSLKALQPNP